MVIPAYSFQVVNPVLWNANLCNAVLRDKLADVSLRRFGVIAAQCCKSELRLIKPFGSIRMKFPQ